MLQKKIIIHGRLIINVKIGKRTLCGWTMNNSDIIGPFIMVILQEFILKKNLIGRVASDSVGTMPMCLMINRDT